MARPSPPCCFAPQFPQSTWFLCSREAAATPVELRSGRTMGNLLPFPLPVCPSQKPGRWHLPREQLLSVAPSPSRTANKAI